MQTPPGQFGFFIIVGLFLLLSSFPAPLESRRHRTLGEPCDDVDLLMRCARGLECAVKGTGGKRRCRPATSTSGVDDENRCLRAKCPVLFPDCPSDSVPVLSTGPVSASSSSSSSSATSLDRQAEHDQQCCPPALVQCRCDPQKCLVPACPEGTERLLNDKGTDRPGHCCDRFECRPSEPNCQDINCPDPTAVLLDLYSADGHSCPEDSYRPEPYVPPGACCPIVPQCQCKPGICEPVRHCPRGQKLVIERRGRAEPGRCCDHYKCVPKKEGEREADGPMAGGGCKHQGRIFAEGERWHAAPCQECQCSATGVALCRRMECPALTVGCQWVGLSPGECCPVCLGCRDEQGQTYEPGQHWERDGCTNCTCGTDFRWQCQKFICQTLCEQPRPVPGECCPVCDEQATTVVLEPTPSCPPLAECPLRCPFGLQQDRWTGCFECRCANGTAGQEQTMREQQCEPLAVESCPKLCAHGYLLDARGCAHCRCAHCPLMANCWKNCVHGLEANWMGCPICKCRADDQQQEGGEQALAALPEEEAASSSSPSNSSPQHCTSLSSTHSQRDMGEWWTENCRQCFCQQGKEFCSLLACPARLADCPEEFWIRFEGECCPRCAKSPQTNPTNSTNSSLEKVEGGSQQQGAGQQVCHSPGTGQLFVDGQNWHLAQDHCLGCTCRLGHVLCVWNNGRPCPASPCDRPVFDPVVDKCCPRCPSSSRQSASDDDERTTSSIAAAVEEEEGPLTVCEDSATGTTYTAMAEWRRDECQSCKCTAQGRIECHRERCGGGDNEGSGKQQQSNSCTSGRWLSLKGRCCPICSDSLAKTPTCLYEGRAYAPGEQFQDGPCRNCTCLPGGLLKCTEIHCLAAACPQRSEDEQQQQQSATTTPPAEAVVDQCCPVCHSQSDRQQKMEEEEEELLFSSFEQGAEQTVFIGSSLGQDILGQVTNENADESPPSLWLLVGIAIPVLAFCLFAIGVACLVLKCRKERTKWASAIRLEKNGRNPIRWHLRFPDRNTERRAYPTRKEVTKDAAANISLLRLKEEKLLMSGDN